VTKVRRAPRAIADETEIWLNIAIDSPRAADRIARQIYDAEDRLARFPRLGRARDELAPGVRSWVVGDYLIYYRIEADVVIVLRILHGARDINDLISED
jgi:toxin ParE1/3/4